MSLLRLTALIALSLLAFLRDGCAAPEAEDCAGTLERTEQMRQLVRTRRRAAWNFRLTGLVTAVLRGDKFVLEDATGSFCLFSCRSPLPQVGDVVRASGTIVNLNTRRDELQIERGVSVERLGHTNDVPVLTVPIARIANPELDLRRVRIVGTVISALRDDADDRWEILLVKDGIHVVPVAVPISDRSVPTPHRSLTDAKVAVTGVCLRNVSGLRCCLGPYVEAFGESDITVVTAAPTDPFDAPPLETFGVYNAVEIAAMGRRSLVGTTIATWLPNRACVLEDDGNPVLVAFADDIPLPAVGQRLRACGYPGTDLYAITLGLARWRPEPGVAHTPVSADGTNDVAVFLAPYSNYSHGRANLRGRLLTLSGVVTETAHDLQTPGRFRLACASGIATVDVSTHPDAGRDLAVGCEAKVCGICLYETEEWGPRTVLPRLKERLLVVRSATDIVILRTAPWWTVRSLFLLVCLLLGVVGLLAIRSQLLKRRTKLRVEERTRLAVELHDSLSQNLAAASFEISAARCARAVDRDGADRHLETADRMLRSSRTHLRQCLWDLRADTLESVDFAQAIRDTVRLVAEGANVHVHCTVPRALMNDTLAHGILCILRELVSNAVRHGQATTVRIAGVQENGGLAFSVRDNGKGFDPSQAPGLGQGHFGLVGIHDRIRSLGGTFTLVAKSEQPTRAVIRLPVSNRRKHA